VRTGELERITATPRAIIEQGKESDELNQSLDTNLALDLIYGPIYYRLLVGHQPIDDALAKGLSGTVVSALRTASN